MTYPISKRASDTIKNQRLLISMQKLVDQIEVEPSNTVTGISSHERIHLLDALKRYLARVDSILAEEIK